MADEENPPLDSVDIEWLDTHILTLRHELASQPDAELRRAAKLSIAAADDALEDGDLRHAALQYIAAAFLVEAAKGRMKTL